LAILAAGSNALAADPLPAIDFSTAGYGGGGVPFASPAARFRVKPSGGDDTALLQAAIDNIENSTTVQTTSPNVPHTRGTLLLDAGTFHVRGQLLIRTGGIILRGAGQNATTIVAEGTGRRPLFEIGEPPKSEPIGLSPVAVTDEIVPAGGTTLTVENISRLNVESHILITHPCTQEWVASLGRGGGAAGGGRGDAPAGRAGGGRGGRGGPNWPAGSRDIHWDRIITAVDPQKKQITLDAPITTSIERRLGGATVNLVPYATCTDVGIENLTLESAADPANPKDEDHSWFAIHLDNLRDAWVSNVTMRKFAFSAVHVGPRGRRITIENCRSEDPISEDGGYRRQAFFIEGQQVLVHGCYSEKGMADFSLGLCAAGPNVFLDCQTKGSLGWSGALENWASGALFERVHIDGADLRLGYETQRTSAGGWTAGNSVIRDCQAREIVASGPASAPVVVSDSHEPLYESQLKARGKSIPLPAKVAAENVPSFVMPVTRARLEVPPLHPFTLTNGWYVVDGKTAWGPMLNEGWWRGNPIPALAQANGGISASRWIPGRIGHGLTEDLPAVADVMSAQRVPFYQSIPGLWYDRRRDEHSVTQRPDGYVWAPFLELPWARSGQGTAWDGLSKYDLTKFNNWYFDRYREMADLCDQRGFIMIHHLYDTHDVLEIPQHWIDYPFRPANNINHTDGPDAGIPEPPPADGPEGTKNLHVANQVYDIDKPLLRDLHHRLIIHDLDVLGDKPNVIFSLSFQFVGPLKFQQFFLDTVAEWEKAHNHQVKVALITTKDITDAILADPVRSKDVVLVDMRYWQYRPDGSLFAPAGGQNRAFREMVQKALPGNSDHPPGTSPEQAYRQVREYRDKYPQLALSTWNNGAGQMPALLAGASQVMMYSPYAGHNQIPGKDRTPVDTFVQDQLASTLMTMKPVDKLASSAAGSAWVLADDARKNLLVYSTAGPSITLATLPGKLSGTWFDPSTGKTLPADSPPGFSGVTLTKPSAGAWALWLKAE
jgi:hypothetical protein